ncbi:dipeptide ABC transporter ATP-binding protein [Streptomyces litchfieldiae]|uniref:Dipeptide ABC transporter ATP-binding protein n=1 Tax=Streptomyces litchfieldiae TaxID=3075543 RepID=A0ABU2MWN6_9ACTN|nr:dipeptide ABC transporter ATP-binding protein [Streptomyces sp. DSM 44938]MDT0345925.1 dipeptide ABC transporter ATP-binding protein [Streptomyces sp. DSM 44938]
MNATPVLDVADLHVEFDAGTRRVRAVNGVGFQLAPGETLGIVGESGSGKSTTALALMRMLPGAGRITGGAIRLDGRDLADAGEDELRRTRGARIAMIFQDPMTALNPVLSVGRQLDEAMRAHGRGDRAARARRAVELLDLVGIPEPHRRVRDYPHQFSGGQRQRVVIALALANEPDVLLADEPTTALDATVQDQILRLLDRLNRETGTSLVIITHNMGVVARATRRVLVMYGGTVVEDGPTERVLTRPRHPYTAGLLAAVPRLDTPSGTRLHSIPGTPPDLARSLTGCAFAARCPLAEDRCTQAAPPLVTDADTGVSTACWVTLPPAVNGQRSPERAGTAGRPVTFAPAARDSGPGTADAPASGDSSPPAAEADGRRFAARLAPAAGGQSPPVPLSDGDLGTERAGSAASGEGSSPAARGSGPGRVRRFAARVAGRRPAGGPAVNGQSPAAISGGDVLPSARGAGAETAGVPASRVGSSPGEGVAAGARADDAPGVARPTPPEAALLEVTALRKTFPRRGRGGRRDPLVALDGVDLTLAAGETLGIVGESGSGKSTLARTIVRVHPATSGIVVFRGRDVTTATGADLKALRREVQMVFQDPYASLNPRMTVGRILAEPLIAHGLDDRPARVAALLEQVGLDPGAADRHPRDFSGGQRQRIGIARALAPEPSVLICDEPVSALDVSVQAQVVNLLTDLQQRLGLALVFIAHDLAVVRQVSHRIAVMRQGRIVETGPADDICERPAHPYTRALLAAAPVPGPAAAEAVAP